MSKEPTKEEMKEALDGMCLFLGLHGWNKTDERVMAIYRLIESHITDEQLFEIKAQEYERGLKDGKPEVDKEFIERWTKKMIDVDNLITTEEEFIVALLQEIPVRIKED